jgi:hypothetical protein
MQHSLQRGVDPIGGVLSYPPDQLHQEVALIAYHFHWSLTDIISLEHGDRRRWVQEIGRVNATLGKSL